MNDSDDYYNRKSEQRSSILRPLLWLVIAMGTLCIWYFIITTITKAL